MTSKITYLGKLRSEAIHLASGQAVIMDAPTDNHGLGQAFSPTDLVATSLGACIVTTLGIVIQQGRLPELEMKCDITKTMGDGPRVISRIEINLYIHAPSGPLSDEQKVIIERIAHTCPVAKSLHPDLNQKVNFFYKDKKN